jgi:hypothetical protein
VALGVVGVVGVEDDGEVDVVVEVEDEHVGDVAWLTDDVISVVLSCASRYLRNHERSSPGFEGAVAGVGVVVVVVVDPPDGPVVVVVAIDVAVDVVVVGAGVVVVRGLVAKDSAECDRVLSCEVLLSLPVLLLLLSNDASALDAMALLRARLATSAARGLMPAGRGGSVLSLSAAFFFLLLPMCVCE